MYRFFEQRYKEIIIVLILIFVLITVSTIHRLEYRLRWYDKAVLFVTAPVQYALTAVIKGSIRFFENYLFLIEIKDDNRFLVQENKELKYKLDQLKELKFENLRLRKLLLFKEKMSTFMLPAEIVAMDASSIFRTIRINKGKPDGVEIAMPVVNHEGVVGRIIRVFSNYSDVLLITDPNSAVDVIVQRSRARGVVEGLSKLDCRLKYLDRLDDVEKGDKIVTSGLASYFPKGVLIGEVVDVERKKYGITQNVKITPSVNFDKLEEVFVVMMKK